MTIIIIDHVIITHKIHGPATESFPRYRSVEERAIDFIMINDDHDHTVDHDFITHVLHGPATESFPRYRSIEERASVTSL
jgi:hypothetical protein